MLGPVALLPAGWEDWSCRFGRLFGYVLSSPVFAVVLFLTGGVRVELKEMVEESFGDDYKES